jgi:hypothetical protein
MLIVLSRARETFSECFGDEEKTVRTDLTNNQSRLYPLLGLYIVIQKPGIVCESI